MYTYTHYFQKLDLEKFFQPIFKSNHNQNRKKSKIAFDLTLISDKRKKNCFVKEKKLIIECVSKEKCFGLKINVLSKKILSTLLQNLKELILLSKRNFSLTMSL